MTKKKLIKNDISDNAKYITTATALDLIRREAGLDITLPTLLSWVNAKNMGYKIGGRWMIERSVLLNYILRENK